MHYSLMRIVIISLSICLTVVLGFSAFRMAIKDRTDLLAQSWQLSEMQVQGQQYSEEWLARQRQNGLVTILQFQKNGICLVHLKTRKGKTTKRNKWAFADNQTKLIITPEAEPPQTFEIHKLSAKKMVLLLDDNGTKQTFVYKALKD